MHTLCSLIHLLLWLGPPIYSLYPIPSTRTKPLVRRSRNAMEPSLWNALFVLVELRLQQCKTLPGGPSIEYSVVPEDSTSHPTPRTMGPPIPISILAAKDDPFFVRKPAHLSKEKRKEVKSADADRVAKRLAKKKARNAPEAPSKESERVEELTACVDREDSRCTFH